MIIYVKLFSYESCVSCHLISGSFCQNKQYIVIPLPNWHNWISNRPTFYTIINKYISGGGSKQILQAGSARKLHESQCERAWSLKAWINLDKKVVNLDSHCCYKSWNMFSKLFFGSTLYAEQTSEYPSECPMHQKTGAPEPPAPSPPVVQIIPSECPMHTPTANQSECPSAAGATADMNKIDPLNMMPPPNQQPAPDQPFLLPIDR